MSGVSCLYRRPSGIYVVRLVVPVRLRSAVGRGEIHVSTGLRDCNAAKLASLNIQSHWRERFMALDIAKLVVTSPLLHGEGLISICEAAKTIGLSHGSLLGELLHERPALYVQAQHWRGWQLDDLDLIEIDHDGTFILNSVEKHGLRQVLSGVVRCHDAKVTIAALLADGVSAELMFLGSGEGAFWVIDSVSVQLSAWMVQKGAVERVRARLVSGLLPEQRTSAVALEKPAVERVVILDTVDAKHGKKRFSELFELYLNHRKWGVDQTRRMTTEAGLFIELMDDPLLGTIEVETIHQYAALLSRLPNDIYLCRRRFSVESLCDLIAIAERESLPRKNRTTVKGHVGRVGEILNYGVKPAGMLRVNPASGFKRDWGVSKKGRPQDDRDEFAPEELDLIFSQDWFPNGAGAISQKGATNWRPHCFWMPLLALVTGARLNELAQLRDCPQFARRWLRYFRHGQIKATCQWIGGGIEVCERGIGEAQGVHTFYSCLVVESLVLLEPLPFLMSAFCFPLPRLLPSRPGLSFGPPGSSWAGVP